MAKLSMEAEDADSIDLTMMGRSMLSGNYFGYADVRNVPIVIISATNRQSYAAVTRIANAADHIKGVINLRGIVVPIIDMRIKFKLGTSDYSPLTVVIILNIGNHVVGMVVDSISDVLSLDAHNIKPAPPIAAKNDMDYLLGWPLLRIVW